MGDMIEEEIQEEEVEMPAWESDGGKGPVVLKVFEALKVEFMDKFKAMWA
jgi:hypothetical protein